MLASVRGHPIEPDQRVGAKMGVTPVPRAQRLVAKPCSAPVFVMVANSGKLQSFALNSEVNGRNSIRLSVRPVYSRNNLLRNARFVDVARIARGRSLVRVSIERVCGLAGILYRFQSYLAEYAELGVVESNGVFRIGEVEAAPSDTCASPWPITLESIGACFKDYTLRRLCPEQELRAVVECPVELYTKG